MLPPDRERLTRAPGAEVARIIDAIERDFLRLRGTRFHEELTTLIVKALLPAAGDMDTFLRAYDEFVGTNKARLAHVFEEYRADLRHVLLGQPESLLVFYLLEANRSGLEEHWPTQVPEKMREGLEGVWVPDTGV